MINLEAAIITRLEPALPADEIALMAWPDNPRMTNKPVGAAAVMVRFSRLQLSSPGTINRSAIIQSGSIEIELRFLVKDLRSHFGAYELMAQSQRTLTGWLPEDAELDDGLAPRLPGFYLLRTQLVDRNTSDRVWDWGQMYSLDVDYKGEKHGR